MITETQHERAVQNFSLAAQEFDFKFQEPFVINEELRAFGHITKYGSKNGTVICLCSPPDYSVDREKEILDWCQENGFYCSFLNAELLTGEYNRSYFRDMLRDWGKY